MTRPCDLLTPYVDGELDPADAESFALHLGTCPTCPGELHEALQLLALEASVRQMEGSGEHVLRPVREPRPSDPIPISQARTRRSLWPKIAIVGAVAAAAALVLYFVIPRGSGGVIEPTTIAIATAPTRAIEGRISYSGAAAHRPYRVDRAGSAAAPADSISQMTLAQLEQRGDLHGLAAAQLLLGETERARGTLERAGANLDVEADRALLLLSGGKPADALVALDAILERSPKHPAALWNRALALRDLELPIVAAEAFEAAAALDEPGWSDEAKRRAAELAASIRARKEPFEQLLKDGPSLAVAPTAVTPALARRVPGLAQLFFYDGVRGASSADVVRQLAPLARELDAIAGGDHLARYVERTADANFATRGPLAQRYAALVQGAQLDAPGFVALLEAARRAKQDDIVLGTAVRAIRARAIDADSLMQELRRLAEATEDPWFVLLAAEHEANAFIARGKHDAAEVVLLRGLAHCAQSQLDFRCGRLEAALGDSYLWTMRLADARRVLNSAWARARRAGEWNLEQELLPSLTNLENLGDQLEANTLAMVRGYTRELVLRAPERCEIKVWESEALAFMLSNRRDFAGARRELDRTIAATRGCMDARWPIDMVVAKAHVLRDDPRTSPAERTEFLSTITNQRGSASMEERTLYDRVEGMLIIDRDRAAGTALLERVIAATRDSKTEDPIAHKTRWYAYSDLILDAARAGEWDRVWHFLDGDAELTARATCAVGIAIDGPRSAVVVRAANGAARGRYEGDHRGRELQQLITASMQTELAACTDIEVIARSPVHGTPGLFGKDIAWGYRSGRDAKGASTSGLKRLVISNSEPPAALGLPRLLPWRSSSPDTRVLEGAAATPTRALSELADAGYVEIHVHGMVNPAISDASFLMMSPESEGRYALTAAMIRKQPLRGRPLVILAACHAARTAVYTFQPWTLPTAFVEAGARAVVASPEPIDDAQAGAFFDQLRVRLDRGQSPAVALRDARKEWLVGHPTATWVGSLMVFY